MPVTINPSKNEFNTFIARRFSYSSDAVTNSLKTVRLYSGPQPLNPALAPTGSILTTQSADIPTAADWLPATEGAITLSRPIYLTCNLSGIPSFARIDVYANSLGTIGVFDIPVGTAPGSPMVLSTTELLNVGDVVAITDFRLKLPVSGPFCFSLSVANSFLDSLARGNVSPRILDVGYFSSIYLNGSTLTYNRPVVVEAWDGVIPDNTSAMPTGTKLWEAYSVNTSVTSDPGLFIATGTTLTLNKILTANAIATGVPTFVRVVTSAIGTFPEHRLQAPVGSPDLGAIFDRPDFVIGQPASLTRFNIRFLP